MTNGCWKSRVFFIYRSIKTHQILYSCGIMSANEVMPLTLDLKARRGPFSNRVDRKRRAFRVIHHRKWTNVPNKGTIAKGHLIFQPFTFTGYVSFRGGTAWNRNNFWSLRKGSHHSNGDELLSSVNRLCLFNVNIDIWAAFATPLTYLKDIVRYIYMLIFTASTTTCESINYPRFSAFIEN